MAKSNTKPAAKTKAKSRSKAPKPFDPGALTRNDIAHILDDVSVMLEIRGDNPFRCRAFYNAARALEELTEDIRAMIASKGLLDVQGIGKGIFADIASLLEVGTFPLYDDLRTEIPAGVLDMLRIQGMGPKKVKLVFTELGIQSVAELEHAGRAGKLAELPGFGEKTEINILRGIARMRKYQSRFLFSAAYAEAAAIHDIVRNLAGVTRSMIGGSLRRCRETIGDIDILASADDAAPIMEVFTTQPNVATVVAKGPTKSSVILESGINVDLRVVRDDEYPFATHYFTGSKAHNTEVRAIAKKNGYKLNEYGLFKGAKPTRCKDEAELFAKLGLELIPPELRENNGEIEAAREHALPKLVEAEDIRGVFHNHTTYSDGRSTLREMVAAARALGHAYFGVGDHGESTVYAKGLPRARVAEQAEEIARINSELAPFVVFHGTEVDILGNGKLGYPDEVLAQFDYVVASVHGQFNMSESEMTDRIVTAMSNPYVTMLGHPTGRVLLSREGYNVNLQAIIEAAAAHDVIIEINAYPNRLDLDWRHVKSARDAGVLLAVNPDAHFTADLDFFRYGVNVARKGWLESRHLLNTRTVAGVRKYFESRKRKRGIAT